MYKNIDKKTANKRLNYNSLINQKSSFESQINTYKMTLADLEDKYERLDSTYKIIEQILLDLYSRHDFNFDACVKQYNTQINDMCNSKLFVENMANELSVKLTEYIK